MVYIMLQKNRILIYAINYSPEIIGCGRYTTEVAEYLVEQGKEVEVVTTPPHYPGWQARDGYKALSYKFETTKDKGKIYRCPILLKKKMSGLWRAIAPISFAISSAPIVFWRILTFRPDTVFCVEPTLFAAPAALFAAKLVGAKTVLHVQDLEIDAAFAVGHIKSGFIQKITSLFDKVTTGAFDKVITISNNMKAKLIQKGINIDKIEVVRNWVDTSKIYPLSYPSALRKDLGLSDDQFVALYAGNIGKKQALYLVADAAEKLQDNKKITFVIAGEGPEKDALIARNLPNMVFLPLQPEEKLNDLLNLANVHLLPQDKDVADLVLPSKIGGMLASGKPIIAMADEGTEIYEFLKNCVTIVPSGDVPIMTSAIKSEFDNNSIKDMDKDISISSEVKTKLEMLNSLPELAKMV